MRIILVAVLMFVSGSALAKPAMSFDVRFGNDARHHDSRDHKVKHRKVYKKRQHAARYVAGRDYGSQRHYQNKRDSKQAHTGRAGHWIRADQFRTRRHHASDPVIHINARISALGMTGLKRDAHIRRAYVEFGNGSIVPLAELQGGLYRGSQTTRYFKQPRFVKRLILRVAPANRHKRAYVGVDYLLAGSDQGRGHNKRHGKGQDKHGTRRDRY